MQREKQKTPDPLSNVDNLAKSKRLMTKHNFQAAFYIKTLRYSLLGFPYVQI